MKKLLPVLFSGLLSTVVSAQTPTVPAPVTLATLLRQANEAARVTSQQFKDATENEAPFNACKAELLDFAATYHRWFISHIGEFQRRDQELRDLYGQISQKIESLKSVEMLQLESQDEKKEISLRTITDFLATLNRRLATAPQDQLDLVLSQMEKPQFNSTGATLAQIKEAVRLMTVNLNARLKETSASYRLEFTPRERSYDLDFVVSLDEKGQAKTYRFSLIGGAATGLSDEKRLQLIVSSNDKIDGYSLDANKRYFEMYQKMVNPRCQEERVTLYDYEGSPLAKPAPWLNPAQLKAKIPTEISPVSQQNRIIKNHSITFTGTDTMTNILINGVSINCNMLKNEIWLAEAGGHVVVFAVGYNQTFWYYNGANWLQIIPNTDAFHILYATTRDGTAVAKIQTSHGFYNIDGNGQLTPLSAK